MSTQAKGLMYPDAFHHDAEHEWFGVPWIPEMFLDGEGDPIPNDEYMEWDETFSDEASAFLDACCPIDDPVCLPLEDTIKCD